MCSVVDIICCLTGRIISHINCSAMTWVRSINVWGQSREVSIVRTSPSASPGLQPRKWWDASYSTCWLHLKTDKWRDLIWNCRLTLNCWKRMCDKLKSNICCETRLEHWWTYMSSDFIRNNYYVSNVSLSVCHLGLKL